MMSSSRQFTISQLRHQSTLKMIESIAVIIFALFITALLPQLLFKYIYANQQLTEEPAIFGYIQNGAFVLGFVYFLYAAWGNFLRSMKISKLEKEMMGGAGMESCCEDCGGACSCNDHEHCQCGCDEMSETNSMMNESQTASAVQMMKKAGGKRRNRK